MTVQHFDRSYGVYVWSLGWAIQSLAKLLYFCVGEVDLVDALKKRHFLWYKRITIHFLTVLSVHHQVYTMQFFAWNLLSMSSCSLPSKVGQHVFL